MAPSVIPHITEVQAFLTKRLIKPVEFDDRVDQLNYLVTPSLILAFAVIVSSKIYGGEPMNCLLPTSFSQELRKFAMDYCFLENVYFVGLKEDIPTEVLDRESREFKYYQWVPYLLLLQAALFNLPIWAWKNHYRQSEVNPDLVMKDARKLKSMREQERKQMLKLFVSEVAECLDLDERQRAFRQTVWYLFTKTLFLLNVVLQFVLVGSFIGRGYNQWCWNVFLSTFGLNDPRDDRWEKAPVFPTDALCDFVVRQLGNAHRHTIQCMLTINQFNEKMFLFFSVYFFIVGVITFLNLLSWLLALACPSERYRAVRLLIKKEHFHSDECKLYQFVDRALKTDGVLFLHFIKSTAGAFVARDVCTQLFVAYKPSSYPCVTGSGLTSVTSSGPSSPPPMTPASKLSKTFGKLPLSDSRPKPKFSSPRFGASAPSDTIELIQNFTNEAAETDSGFSKSRTATQSAENLQPDVYDAGRLGFGDASDNQAEETDANDNSFMQNETFGNVRFGEGNDDFGNVGFRSTPKQPDAWKNEDNPDW
ncbi:Innexin inx-3 [Aphelenchoides avenae]|nr:Innexin inx-3 [Aphelenchus avenae]